MGKICFFLGNRDAPAHIMDFLRTSVRHHILEYGVTDFYVGSHGNFDHMAARAVIEEKKNSPEIQLHLVLAYHPGARPFILPEGFDDSVYPEGMEFVPQRLALLKVNQYMIHKADYLIVYSADPAGNTKKYIARAKGRVEQGLLKIEDMHKLSTTP